MQKWEYKIIDATTDSRDLNVFGENGWELVLSTSDTNSETLFYFKRPKSDAFHGAS